MSEVLYERLKENLEALKMRHTLEILDNYLRRVIKDESYCLKERKESMKQQQILNTLFEQNAQ